MLGWRVRIVVNSLNISFCTSASQSGATCTQNNQPTECVPNAVCENKGSGIKCYCTSDYYDSNGINPDGTCSASKSWSWCH